MITLTSSYDNGKLGYDPGSVRASGSRPRYLVIDSSGIKSAEVFCECASKVPVTQRYHDAV